MNKIVIGGIYKHYKGNKYKALDIVRHSETNEKMVLYECLYENPRGKLWVRPLLMFLESIVKDGKRISRFELINE